MLAISDDQHTHWQKVSSQCASSQYPSRTPLTIATAWLRLTPTLDCCRQHCPSPTPYDGNTATAWPRLRLTQAEIDTYRSVARLPSHKNILSCCRQRYPSHNPASKTRASHPDQAEFLCHSHPLHQQTSQLGSRLQRSGQLPLWVYPKNPGGWCTLPTISYKPSRLVGNPLFSAALNCPHPYEL